MKDLNRHKKIKLICEELRKQGHEISEFSFEAFCSLSHFTLDLIIEDLKIDLESKTIPIKFQEDSE